MEDLVGIGKLANSKLANKFYDDLLREAMQEGGKALADLVRMLRGSVELIASTPQRLLRFLERVRQRVPKERQIEAPPSIALPVLSELRFMEDGNLLTELYLNLLARAIDKERISEAHPAFVQIIRQLSPDEAMIMFKLRNEPKIGVSLKVTPEWLTYPGNFLMYISHLESLNLIHSRSTPNLEVSSPDPRDAYQYWVETSKFGQLFVKACIPEDFDVLTLKQGEVKLATSLSTRNQRKTRARKKVSLVDTPFCGMWKDREDITDGQTFARQLRRMLETRGDRRKNVR